jgi:hypothetical protein
VSFSCVHLKDVEETKIWMEHISLFFLPPYILHPLAKGSCKPKVQVQDDLWSHCKTKALFSYARNQVFKPSAEMELVRWPCAARSTTYEQDWSVCDFAYLFTTRKVFISDDLLVMLQTLVTQWYVFHDEMSIFVISCMWRWNSWKNNDENIIYVTKQIEEIVTYYVLGWRIVMMKLSGHKLDWISS